MSTEPKFKKITGTIKLEGQPTFFVDCFSKKIPIKINSFDGFLLTPYINNDKTIVLPQKSNLNFNTKLNWGSYLDDKISVINLVEIELLIPNELSNNENKVLEKEIDEFRNRILDSFFILGLNIDNYTSVFKLNSDYNRFTYCDENNERRPYFEIDFDLNFNNLQTVCYYEKLEEILEKASNNWNLKMPFSLMRTARKALINKDYRTTILNSASAFEIGLLDCIIIELGISKKFNEDIFNEVLSRYNSISKKRELLKNSNRFTLPVFDYKNKIERIRNKTIHAGFLPNKTEANEVYTIIWKVLSSIKIEKYSK
jgi:hypothetical protein